MKKIHEKLKASARGRREGTGRVDRQSGIIDDLVAKRKETKMYAEIGRKAVEQQKSRSEMPQVSQKNIPTKSYITPNEVISNIKFGQQPEKVRENFQAYDKAKVKPTVPKKAPVQQKPVQAPFRTELGDGGEGRPVNLEKRIAATPKATGAVENRGSDLMNITAVGAVAGLVGAGMRYAGRKVAETAGKEFTKATAKMATTKTVAPTVAKPATTSLFKQSGTAQAGKGFWKDFGTSAPKTNPFEKAEATTFRKSLAGSDVPPAGSKLFTSKVGQNTVKQTTSAKDIFKAPTTTQGRGRSLAGSDVVPMASKTVAKPTTTASSEKVVTKAQWDRTSKDYKGIVDGKPYMMSLDPKTGSTVYGPVKISDASKVTKKVTTPKKGKK